MCVYVQDIGGYSKMGGCVCLICKHTCMHTNIYTQAHNAYKHTHTHSNTHIHTFVYKFVCMYLCTHVHTCISIQTYLCVHTYTHNKEDVSYFQFPNKSGTKVINRNRLSHLWHSHHVILSSVFGRHWMKSIDVGSHSVCVAFVVLSYTRAEYSHAGRD